MPRQARLVIPGAPHHVVQRGNHQKKIFFCDKDRSHFLKLVKEYSKTAELNILAYCLMTNHAHFIAIPLRATSLARALKLINMCYSQYLNRIHGKSGINWQGRYFSSAMDEEYTYRAIQYVILNPVRANLVTSPELYQWSSAAAHLGYVVDDVLSAGPKLREIAALATKEVASPDNQCALTKEFELIARMTYSNLPIGSDKFIQSLEQKLERKLLLRNIGRQVGYRPKRKNMPVIGAARISNDKLTS